MPSMNPNNFLFFSQIHLNGISVHNLKIQKYSIHKEMICLFKKRKERNDLTLKFWQLISIATTKRKIQHEWIDGNVC